LLPILESRPEYRISVASSSLTSRHQSLFPRALNSVRLVGLNFFVQHNRLRDLYDKVADGERISEAGAQGMVYTRPEFH
jgi:hypothetical protein